VKANGVQFVYIKATEGDSEWIAARHCIYLTLFLAYTDPMFTAVSVSIVSPGLFQLI
jgi:hypothetical protein